MVTQQTNLPARFAVARPVADEIEIHADDAGTVALFFALGTQWHRHPFSGHRTGIDYSAIRPTAELIDVALSPATLPALQEMEHAAIAVFAEAAR